MSSVVIGGLCVVVQIVVSWSFPPGWFSGNLSVDTDFPVLTWWRAGALRSVFIEVVIWLTISLNLPLVVKFANVGRLAEVRTTRSVGFSPRDAAGCLETIFFVTVGYLVAADGHSGRPVSVASIAARIPVTLTIALSQCDRHGSKLRIHAQGESGCYCRVRPISPQGSSRDSDKWGNGVTPRWRALDSRK